jgi:hypothetical protein
VILQPFSQRLAQKKDMLPEIGFLDKRIAPKRLHQGIFQGHLTTSLDQGRSRSKPSEKGNGLLVRP